MTTTEPVSYGLIIRRAWPLILANCSVPLLGLADTAVLGNLGSLYDLGAIALGALIFSFVYWGFGFLRMGTTGFIAQADGRQDPAEVRAVMIRSLVLATALGILLTLLQVPLAGVAFNLLGGSEQVEAIARSYFLLRIWGAPATLGTFVLVGVLIGLGESKRLLLVQLFLNLLNIALDLYFAGYLRLGAQGVAMGTLVAEWSAFGFALWLVVRLLHKQHRDSEKFLVPDRLGDAKRMLAILSANTDIMIRTVVLVFSFAWFTNQSARFGDVVLAANHILLQLVSFSAFFLDGFAFVGESLVGRATGAGNGRLFDLAVRRTTVLAFATALVLATLVATGGNQLIADLTDIALVQIAAMDMLYLAVIYILVSFAAFQLDGIFIGATRTVQMRNASLAAGLIFLLGWWLLSSRYGITGLWLSFILYVCARALTLLLYFPGLRKSIH
ncbi:MAG: MATE family efflux transporter [Gammaproteobacteria bacterium]|nr:MATE family efflux transporter [Pseudomonadales bacterium]MCP5345471.1 MATE family efflux transporter [Pseudomonadales bacterium]